MKYVCDVCGYVYDEAAGDPDNGIAAGTKFTDLPADWKCPMCMRWFDGGEEPGVSGACVDCEEAEEREYAEFELEQEKRSRYEEGEG